jgi:hypothetical protein
MYRGDAVCEVPSEEVAHSHWPEDRESVLNSALEVEPSFESIGCNFSLHADLNAFHYDTSPELSVSEAKDQWETSAEEHNSSFQMPCVPVPLDQNEHPETAEESTIAAFWRPPIPSLGETNDQFLSNMQANEHEWKVSEGTAMQKPPDNAFADEAANSRMLCQPTDSSPNNPPTTLNAQENAQLPLNFFGECQQDTVQSSPMSAEADLSEFTRGARPTLSEGMAALGIALEGLAPLLKVMEDSSTRESPMSDVPAEVTAKRALRRPVRPSLTEISSSMPSVLTNDGPSVNLSNMNAAQSQPQLRLLNRGHETTAYLRPPRPSLTQTRGRLSLNDTLDTTNFRAGSKMPVNGRALRSSPPSRRSEYTTSRSLRPSLTQTQSSSKTLVGRQIVNSMALDGRAPNTQNILKYPVEAVDCGQFERPARPSLTDRSNGIDFQESQEQFEQQGRRNDPVQQAQQRLFHVEDSAVSNWVPSRLTVSVTYPSTNLYDSQGPRGLLQAGQLVGMDTIPRASPFNESNVYESRRPPRPTLGEASPSTKERTIRAYPVQSSIQREGTRDRERGTLVSDDKGYQTNQAQHRPSLSETLQVPEGVSGTQRGKSQMNPKMSYGARRPSAVSSRNISSDTAGPQSSFPGRLPYCEGIIRDR